MEWFFALGVAGGTAINAVLAKSAERRGCRVAAFSLVTFGVAGVADLAIAMADGAVWCSPMLWGFGLAMGALYMAASAVSLHGNRCWPPSVVWAAANAGLVVPILVSVLLGEPLRLIDIPILTGIGLMMVGMTEVGGGGTPAVSKVSVWLRWLLVGAVFVSNGLIMAGFKMFPRIMPGQSSASMVAVTFGFALFLALVMHLRGERRVITRSEIGHGLGMGILMGISTVLLLGAMSLPAALVFPVIQGISLVGGAVLCAIIFRERVTWRKVSALAIGSMAIVLTVWR